MENCKHEKFKSHRIDKINDKFVTIMSVRLSAFHAPLRPAHAQLFSATPAHQMIDSRSHDCPAAPLTLSSYAIPNDHPCNATNFDASNELGYRHSSTQVYTVGQHLKYLALNNKFISYVITMFGNGTRKMNLQQCKD